ncbi:MAG: 4Fe-4S dicluster domain-containing protein [Promethearchaeota archaeon]
MGFKVYEATIVIIKIDHDKCKGHAECEAVCPADPNVYKIVDRKSTAPNVETCIECCSYVEACPEEVIEHTSR